MRRNYQMPNINELRKYLRDVKRGYETLELERLSAFIVLGIDFGVSLEELYTTFSKYLPKLSTKEKQRLKKVVLEEFRKRKSAGKSRLEQTCAQT